MYRCFLETISHPRRVWLWSDTSGTVGSCQNLYVYPGGIIISIRHTGYLAPAEARKTCEILCIMQCAGQGVNLLCRSARRIAYTHTHAA